MIFFLSLLLILINFLNPLFYSRHGFFEYEFVKLWFVYIIIFLGWLYLSITVLGKRKIPVPGLSFSLLIAGWLAFYGIASLAGLSVKDSLLGRYGLWLSSFLSFFIFLNLFYLSFVATIWKKKKYLFYLYLALLTSGILISIQGIIEKGLLNPKIFFSVERVSATFVNPNHLAFYLTLILIFSFWLTLFTKERALIILSPITVLFSSIALILTLSRTSWLVIFLTFVISLMLFFLNYHIKKIKGNWWLIGSILIILIVFSPLIKKRVEGTFQNHSPRISYRLRLKEWQTVYKIWQAKPILGIGPENLDLIYPKYRDKSMNLIDEEWQWRTVITRSKWLELLVATGPLGLLFFLGFGFLLLKQGLKNSFVFPLTAITITYYLHSFFYTVSVSAEILFFTLAGVIVAQSSKKILQIKTSKLTAFLIAIFSGVMILILIIIGVSEFKSNTSLKYVTTDIGKANKMIAQAFSLNPVFDKNLRQVLFYQKESIQDLDKGPKREKIIADFKDNLQLLEKRNLKDIENLKTLTSGYMRYAGFTNTSYRKALKWGKELVLIDPTSPGSWDTLGIVYLDSQQHQQALETFNYILEELKPNYPYAYFHLGETYRQMGRPEKSLEYYQKAIELGYWAGYQEIQEAKKEIE